MHKKTLPTLIPLLISLLIYLTPSQLAAQPATDGAFEEDSNGIVTCDGASVGDTGTLNGTIYTKRFGIMTSGVDGLDELLNADPNNPDLATTCTSGITNMSNLFLDNGSFNQDIGSWDVSSVTNMNSMFENATSFNQDIGNWDIGQVNEMRTMFRDAVFDQDIGSWDLSSATLMNGMFRDATVFNQDIGSWDVSSATNLNGMFRNADAFNQDLSNWCVEQFTSKPSGFDFLNDGLQDSNLPDWGTCRSAGLNGAAGFRLFSRPTDGTSFDDLVGPLWTQGIANGADAASGTPNVWTWDNTSIDNGQGNWDAVTDLNDTPSNGGTGFLMFVFEDDSALVSGIQGGFPKMVTINNPATGDVTPEINQNKDQFTLLGNPYDNSIDFTKFQANNTDLNTTVWVYDTDTGNFITSSGGAGDFDGLIAPLQGFLVQTFEASPAQSVTISTADKADTGTAGDFRGKTVQDQEPLAVRMELNENEGELTNSAWLSFSEQGSANGRVRGDALELASLNSESAQLATSKAGTEKLLDINHLPVAYSEAIELPLSISATQSGQYTLEATDFNIPAGIELIFNDLQTGESRPITEAFSYTLNLEAPEQQQAKQSPKEKLQAPELLVQTASETESAAYSITIEPNVITSVGEEGLGLPEKVELDQNFPNPFNPTTTIRFALPESQQVSLEVYDLLGRRVAQLLRNEVRSAGSHSVNFDAASLSSGVYIYQLRAEGGATITRKLTLIK